MSEPLKFALGQRVRKSTENLFAGSQIDRGSTGRIVKIVKVDVRGNEPMFPYCVRWDNQPKLRSRGSGDWPMLERELEALDADLPPAAR